MEQALATIIAALINQEPWPRDDGQFWEALPKQAAMLLYIAEIEYAAMHTVEVPPETGS